MPRIEVDDIRNGINDASEKVSSIKKYAGQAANYAAKAFGALGATGGLVAGAGAAIYSGASFAGVAGAGVIGSAGAGAAAYGLAKNTGTILGGIGSATIGLSDKVGRGIINVASSPTTYSVASSVAGLAAKSAYKTVELGVDALGTIGEKMVRHPIEEFTEADGSKVRKPNKGKYVMSGFGKAATGILGIGSVAASAYQAHNRAHMGTVEGRVQRATPNISHYMNMNQNVNLTANSAGATGDLLFALNRNRNGGYI